MGLDGRTVLRRFLILRASRWFPTGLLIPVGVLYLVDRGLSLAQIGLVFAAQGGVVLLLELPTGGLADAIGRRRVLVLANLFELVSLTMIVLGRSLGTFAVAFALQGVFRALESGPLDAWYVDGTHETAPGADVDRGLSHGGVVLGLAMAAGAIISGALVRLDPVPGLEPLVTPIVFSILLRAGDTIMVLRLMTEVRPPLGRAALTDSAREIPRIIAGAFHLAWTSALGLIVAVELFWGFGMATFEGLFPVRLGEVLGDLDLAAALMGPVAAAAWVVSSGGAVIVPWFSRRLGQHAAAAWMRVLQAATVAAMGFLGGVVGLITAYLMCYVVHGAANPVHLSLLHQQAQSSNRATVASLNSMAGLAAGALGGIVLGAIADNAGISVGMYVGAVVLAAAAPLYVLARRRRPRRPVEVVTEE
jgi:MFS family permease